jgi:hypothetical protein
MVKIGVTSYPVHGAFIHKKETNKLGVCVYIVYYYIYIYLFVGSHPYIRSIYQGNFWAILKPTRISRRIMEK